MDSKEFRIKGKEMIEIAADYLDTIEERKVLPNVQPGYIRDLIPSEAPKDPETWEDVVKDIERVIMPGVTHWHSPHFHAYYVTGNSYPAICADILSAAISCIGFSWIASPACTELEVVMLDWLAQALALPDFYLASKGGLGGGVIQGTASECTYVSLLAARNKKLLELKEKMGDAYDDVQVRSKLVAYVSAEAHSCAERASLFSNCICRKLPVDKDFGVNGETLQKQIDEDKKNGLIPFHFALSLGTTSICSFDKLEEIGPICEKEGVWIHVDAAYAGAAFICPEFRYLNKGVEYTDSFCFNPHKWLLINFDCSAFWIKNRKYLVDAFNLSPIFLQHEYQNVAPDFRHWQIPFGCRFRSLKIWFVLRLFGITALQNYIRKHVELAKHFEKLIRSHGQFEIVGQVLMGLVCFRLKGPNVKSEQLLKSISEEGLIYMVPGLINGVYFIRFAVCAASTELRHIEFAYEVVKKHADLFVVPESLKGIQRFRKSVRMVKYIQDVGKFISTDIKF